MKSPNVFIDDQGRGRLGDLGVAVPMEADGTAEGFNGVQLYTAPETLPTKRADRRTDIYGVGLILHEMLNGPFPWAYYDAESVDSFVGRLEKGQRAVKNEHLGFKPHVPPRLRTIVTKAIQRKPADRFGTAREMLEALTKASFIDWQKVGEPFAWEGSVPTVPEVSYQISAQPRKRAGGWRLSGKVKTHQQWRRFVDDQDIGDLSDGSVKDFFDQIVRDATSR
jgi:serine/threonine protein kinase